MSKLDDYISKLLHDDAALQAFLVDPIKAAEDEHGLTKGQRSVLRRVVANLSNNSTNGYGIVRHLDSYRRSIRLLQNVLHLERGSAISQHSGKQAEDSTSNFVIYVYYNGIPSEPDANNPYAYYMTFVSPYDPNATLKTIMDNATSTISPFLYLAELYTSDVINGEEVVTAFKVVDPYPYEGLYTAAPQDAQTSRAAFWYFSQGGTALSNGYSYRNPYAYSGGPSNTFSEYIPGQSGSSSRVLYWQCIAPDRAYGFQPCNESTVENVFSK